MSYVSESQLRGTLKRGDVYLLHSKIETDQKHFHVILNDHISEHDNLLFLSVATSQIDKRLKYINIQGLNTDTLVIIEVGEVSFFSKRTCFDCNTIIPYGFYDFYNDICEDKCKRQGKIPDYILEKILHGIKISKNISPKIKKQLGLY